MKAVSYAIFGYNRHMQNSYQFDTYMRGLWVNFRVNRVLYPGWQTVVITDADTYHGGPYRALFEYMVKQGAAVDYNNGNESLCLSMLWRLKPAFERNSELKSVFSHVICRDCESIGTYREAQMVQEWITEDKTLHCITDSISHNIPMMGGMVGFRPAYLSQRMGVNTWDQLMALNPGIDFNRKGSDQDFMNRIMYPKLADSATEHFILGMKQTITPTGGRHYEVSDIEVEGVDPVHKSLNDCAGHVGASGFYDPPMIKWLNETDPHMDEYADIERQFPQICFWRK